MPYSTDPKYKEQKVRNRFAGGFDAPTQRTTQAPPSPEIMRLVNPFNPGRTQTSTSQTTSGGTVDAARVLAQGIGKGFLATGQAISAPYFGATLEEVRRTPLVQQPENTLLGKTTRLISGTDQPISLEKEDIDLLGEDYGKATGGNLAIAFALSDLVTGGSASGAKALFNAAKAAKTAQEAAKVMRAVGFTDELVLEFAPRLARLDDLGEIEKELLAAEKLQKTTRSTGNTPVVQRSAIPENLRPLAEEARKYASADEFVRAIDEVRYKSVAMQGPEEGYRPYKLSSDEKTLLSVVNATGPTGAKTIEDIKSQLTDLYSRATESTTPRAIPQTIEEIAPVDQRAIESTPEQIESAPAQADLPEPSLAISPQSEEVLPLDPTLPQVSRTVEDVPTSVPTALSEATYQANRQGFQKSGITAARKSLGESFDSIGKGADVLFGSISTRLKNIDPSLKRAIRTYEYRLSTATHRDHEQVSSFFRALKKSKMPAGEYADLDLALKNGDATKTKQLLEKHGLTEEFTKVRAVLDDLYKRAKAVGYDIGYEKDYFPRTVKDSGGLLEYLQRGDDWSIIDEAIKAKEVEVGYLTTDQKARLINTLIRGFGGKITLSETGAMKARRIDVVDAELNQFYADSIGSLTLYIARTNDAIETRKFFGFGGKAEEFGNIDDSIGAYVLNLLTEGKIKPSQEKELSNILRARFNEVGTSGAMNTYKNLAYIDTMGSVTSAVTQIGDLAISLYKAGPIRTVGSLGTAIAGKSKYTRADLGIERIAAEFADTSKSAKAVNFVFKAIGLTKMDVLGKETFINSVMTKLSSQAKKPTADFYRRLEAVFGDDPDVLDMVTADLKAGRMTEDTKLLAFNELLDVQPVALSEMPEMYLRGGNGRIAYMLKSYTLKLFDIYRNEVFAEMKTNPLKATRNLIALASSLILMNATADEIKDLILNRETSLSDRVVDNMMKLIGFSKYTLYTAREEGPVSAVAKTILPPFKVYDAAFKDIMRQPEGDELETIQSIPIGGKLYYWWFGKGAAKSEKKREKTGGLKF